MILAGPPQGERRPLGAELGHHQSSGLVMPSEGSALRADAACKAEVKRLGGHDHSSSSWWPCWNERHNKTGRINVNTITSLNALAQNEPKLSSKPTNKAPNAAAG